MSNMLSYLAARLKEPTTWMAICTALTSIGVYVAPELKETLITIGVSIGTLLGILLQERGTTPPSIK